MSYVDDYELIESLENLYDQCDTEALKRPMLYAFYVTLVKCRRLAETLDAHEQGYLHKEFELQRRTKNEARVQVDSIRTQYAQGTMDLETVISKLEEMGSLEELME